MHQRPKSVWCFAGWNISKMRLNIIFDLDYILFKGLNVIWSLDVLHPIGVHCICPVRG